MEKQQVILLAILVIVVSIAVPLLSKKLGTKDNKLEPQIPDTVFVPRYTLTDFESKRDVVEVYIRELNRQKGVNCTDYELQTCLNLTKDLEGQLAESQLKYKAQIEELQTYKDKWETICKDFDEIRRTLEDEKKRLEEKVIWDGEVIKKNQQTIDQLEKEVEAVKKATPICHQCQKCIQCELCPTCDDCGSPQTCNQWIARTNNLQNELSILQQNYDTEMNNLKQCLEDIDKASEKTGQDETCKQVKEASINVLREGVKGLKEKFLGLGGKRKEKIDSLIRQTESELSEEQNPLESLSVFGTLLNGMSLELKTQGDLFDEAIQALEDCTTNFQRATAKLGTCEQQLKPFMDK